MMDQKIFNFKEIKLIVGLGNIGDKYKDTRHNVGFMFLNDLANSQFKLETKFEAETTNAEFGTILAKPTTLMNLSGRSVIKIINYFNIGKNEMLIVHDDLDLKIGSYKLQFDKGPHGHNGIISIENAISSSSFWRLRIGVDNRTEELRKNMTGMDYVLGRFNKEEKEILLKEFSEIKTNLISQ